MIVGLDPGAKGGVALWDNAERVTAIPMPMVGDEVAVGQLVDFISLAPEYDGVVRVKAVWIEKVHSMPKQGVASTFKFGRSYGQLLGMCQAMGWTTRLVTPQKWKNAVLADTTKNKDAARAYVTRRWPGLDLRATPRARIVHDGMADALCIAAYGAEHG